VFNIEGGCYAKCIGLQAASEPEIFKVGGALGFSSGVSSRNGSHTHSVPTYVSLCHASCLCHPLSHQAIRFGAVLENVVLNETTREVDFMSK
jgi:phosphoenolpyruvate carboxykinase (ATP)